MLEFYYSNTNKKEKKKKELKNQQQTRKLNLGKLPFHPEGTHT